MTYYSKGITSWQHQAEMPRGGAVWPETCCMSPVQSPWAVGQDRDGPGQWGSWAGPRKGLESLELEAGWEEDSHESRDWQDRPGHEASGSLFQSLHSIPRTEVHCMVFSRDGTRSELHFIAICLWRIGLERKQTQFHLANVASWLSCSLSIRPSLLSYTLA